MILTEQNNPATEEIDLMDAYGIVKAINNEDKKVAAAVEQQLENIAKAVEAMAQSFLKGGKTAYFGAGTSGRLCILDASECWPTFSLPVDKLASFIAGGDDALRHSVENAEDKPELAQKDLNTFNPQAGDVVVGVSASGNSRYVIAALQEARKHGCTTIGITSNIEAKLQPYCDIFICTSVGPEAITGSSRMKSGTAQKMILNMLSTGAMIRIGKTYKNYMIDVQLANKKLFERGARIVAEICGISSESAAHYLEAAGNRVKTACVMAAKQCSPAQAEAILAQANGILRKVIK